MALTATLSLDIRNFEAGLKKAEVELQVFEKANKNLNRDLKRLMEDFSGQKVVVEASRMAEAVERVGGASKLTEKEQQRVNASVTAAIDKYKALGQEAPANLVKLQKETDGAVEKTSLLSKGVQVLVAAFSIRAIAGAANQVLEFTGNLTDLSGKTGVSVEALQRLGYVTAQSGVTLERVADGAVMLGRNLTTGNDSAVKAVEALGFQVSDLIEMGPERAFLAIGEAVAKVPNPMERAGLATAVFGRAGAEYLPAFTSNMTALADEAQRSGAILSEDMVAAGDDAGDAIGRLQAAGMAVLAQFFIPILPAVEALANWLGTALPSAMNSARSGVDFLLRKGLELQVWITDMAVSVSQTVRDVPVLGRVFGQSAADVDELRRSAQYAKDMLSAFNTEAVKPTTSSVEKSIPVVTKFSESMERTSRSTATAAESTRQIIAPVEAFTGLTSRTLAETSKLTQQLEAWSRINMATLAPSILQVNASLAEQVPLVSTMQHEWAQFAPTVEQNTTAASKGISGFFGKVFGGAEGLSSSVTSLFSAAFTGGGGALGAVKAFATQTLSSLMSMIPGIGPFLSAFAGPIVSMLGKLGQKVSDFFRGLFNGPSRDELNGRKIVNEFENNMIGLLNAQQRAEAGGERWAEVTIAVRDAYIAQGRSALEAEKDVGRLFASSQEGAEASRIVVEEITRKMQEQGEAATEAVDAVGDAIRKLPDGKVIDLEIRGRRTGDDEDSEPSSRRVGSLGATGKWFENFGPGQNMRLHGTEAVVRADQAVPFAQDVMAATVGRMKGGGDQGSQMRLMSALEHGDAELKRLIRDLPRAIGLQFRTALQMEGA